MYGFTKLFKANFKCSSSMVISKLKEAFWSLAWTPRSVLPAPFMITSFLLITVKASLMFFEQWDFHLIFESHKTLNHHISY